jgi:hypothetical protein
MNHQSYDYVVRIIDNDGDRFDFTESRIVNDRQYICLGPVGHGWSYLNYFQALETRCALDDYGFFAHVKREPTTIVQ